MRVWGFTPSNINEAAIAANVEIRNFRADGRAFSFTLGLAADHKWQKVNPDPWRGTTRKVAAVCWHGHYCFMRHLFRFNENGRIKATRLTDADYRGLDDFLNTAPNTAQINVGSLMYPVQADETCRCYENDTLLDECFQYLPAR